ncbi:hypothetical protein SynRS9907_01197 [Synechococcus sp. RS9907]|nr:hypothetical protein SynRS9907_01197 [Synechococcus sp. RS9907]
MILTYSGNYWKQDSRIRGESNLIQHSFNVHPQQMPQLK